MLNCGFSVGSSYTLNHKSLEAINLIQKPDFHWMKRNAQGFWNRITDSQIKTTFMKKKKNKCVFSSLCCMQDTYLIIGFCGFSSALTLYVSISIRSFCDHVNGTTFSWMSCNEIQFIYLLCPESQPTHEKQKRRYLQVFVKHTISFPAAVLWHIQMLPHLFILVLILSSRWHSSSNRQYGNLNNAEMIRF